jgi:hypothetical protein
MPSDAICAAGPNWSRSIPQVFDLLVYLVHLAVGLPATMI